MLIHKSDLILPVPAYLQIALPTLFYFNVLFFHILPGKSSSRVPVSRNPVSNNTIIWFPERDIRISSIFECVVFPVSFRSLQLLLLGHKKAKLPTITFISCEWFTLFPEETKSLFPLPLSHKQARYICFKTARAV